MAQSIDVFSAGDKYDFGMGAWSKVLAPLFIEFVGGINAGDQVLDVGCGNGALALTIAQTTKAAKIIGIDPSKGFLDHARSKQSDPRVSFDLGDAQQIPYDNCSFDKCLASLIIVFVPDAPKVAAEMRWVTRPGGIVAACMWDSQGGMEVFETFWNAAVVLDPSNTRISNRSRTYATSKELFELWRGTGLEQVETDALAIPLKFNSFDHLWAYHSKGEGPSSTYTRSLPAELQKALEDRLRKDILGDQPDGPFTLQAKAWAVRGVAP